MKTTDELAQIIWDFNNQQDPIEKSDVILVLGSNDLRVAQRGAELFFQEYAPLLIFSGKEGNFTKGKWEKSEAEMLADVAIAMGVPKKNILIENESTNSGENIIFTKQLLEENKLYPTSFILVQKPYMQHRALATFKKLLPDRKVCITTLDIPFTEYPNEFLSKEHIIHAMVGDLQRLQLYPAKGFSVPVEIPDSVLEAYHELIARGYTSRLLQST